MNWRDIPGCAGYQVSDTGQVRNSRTGRLLKPRLDAARAGFNRRGIHQCLNGSYSQHKGFQWRYA